MQERSGEEIPDPSRSTTGWPASKRAAAARGPASTPALKARVSSGGAQSTQAAQEAPTRQAQAILESGSARS